MKSIHSYENDWIRFREISEDDLDLVRSWRNQDEIRKWFVHSEVVSEASHLEWYQRYLENDQDYYFIVEDKVHGYGSIGTVGFYFLDDGGVEFGRLMIGNEAAKGQGYGYKIMNLFHELVFDVLQVSYSYLEVYCHNKAAVRTYIKAGYEVIDKMNKNKEEMYIMKKTNP